MKVNYGVAHFNLLLPRIKHAFELALVHTVYILPFTILPIYAHKFWTLLLFAPLFRCSNVFHCLSIQCNVSKVEYKLKHGVPTSSHVYIWCDKVEENSSKAFFFTVKTAASAFLILLTLSHPPAPHVLSQAQGTFQTRHSPPVCQMSSGLSPPNCQQSRSAASHFPIIPTCWHTCL